MGQGKRVLAAVISGALILFSVGSCAGPATPSPAAPTAVYTYGTLPPPATRPADYLVSAGYPCNPTSLSHTYLGTSYAKAAFGGAEVKASMKQRQVSGQPVVLELRLENVSEGPLSILPNRDWCDLRVTVCDDTGRIVPFTRFGEGHAGRGGPPAMGSFSPQAIPPGGVGLVRLDVSRIYDLTDAGKYTLGLEVDVYDKAHAGITIKLDGIDFQVQPPSRPTLEIRR